MDLSHSVRASPRRKKAVDPVTLLSFAQPAAAPESTPPPPGQPRRHQPRFARFSQRAGNPIAAQTSIVAKKSEKFFRTLRKRSRSATRLNENNSWASELNLAAGDYGDEYAGNEGGGLSRNPAFFSSSDLNDASSTNVTLVGFSTCLGGSTTNLHRASQPKTFSTLKTSREVKMERERLRQERLAKLAAAGSPDKLLFNANKVFERDKGEPFFEEARTANELFAQFVRENRERFAHHLHGSACFLTLRESSSSSSDDDARRRRQQQQQSQHPCQESRDELGVKREQQSIRVHKIEIRRESTTTTTVSEDKSEVSKVQRSFSSSSSSSSSGFSSIEGSSSSSSSNRTAVEA
jgi:hypothetical protein